MTSGRHNADPIGTLSDTVEAYGEYVVARNLSATYGGFGEIETAEEFWSPEIRGSFFSPVSGVSFQFVNASTGTFEANIEEVDYLEFESPFDKLDELREEGERVWEIISHVRSHLKADFAHQLANRLAFLLEAAREEYPDEVPISPESLRSFISFLQSRTDLKYPDVILCPSKNIRAQWRAASNRHFAVEFLATGDAQFVVFSPDPNHPESTIRLAGLVSIDSLMETIRPHGVLSWSLQ
jgi:hypothetical protein